MNLTFYDFKDFFFFLDNIDECGANPCQNNGECVDLIGAARCVCEAGFSGDFCESENIFFKSSFALLRNHIDRI